MKPYSILIIVAILGLFIAGCSNTTNTTPTANTIPQGNQPTANNGNIASQNSGQATTNAQNTASATGAAVSGSVSDADLNVSQDVTEVDENNLPQPTPDTTS